jgi:carbon storage regulator
MLVLTRKTQEAVVVGGSVSSDPTMIVTVLEIRAGRVKLGFEVAKEIPVHRQEVWQRLREGDPPIV